MHDQQQASVPELGNLIWSGKVFLLSPKQALLCCANPSSGRSSIFPNVKSNETLEKHGANLLQVIRQTLLTSLHGDQMGPDGGCQEPLHLTVVGQPLCVLAHLPASRDTSDTTSSSCSTHCHLYFRMKSHGRFCSVQEGQRMHAEPLDSNPPISILLANPDCVKTGSLDFTS